MTRHHVVTTVRELICRRVVVVMNWQRISPGPCAVSRQERERVFLIGADAEACLPRKLYEIVTEQNLGMRFVRRISASISVADRAAITHLNAFSSEKAQ